MITCTHEEVPDIIGIWLGLLDRSPVYPYPQYYFFWVNSDNKFWFFILYSLYVMVLYLPALLSLLIIFDLISFGAFSFDQNFIQIAAEIDTLITARKFFYLWHNFHLNILN